jgi:hypothetical protein
MLRVIESLFSDLSSVLLLLIMDSRKNINASPSARFKQNCKASEMMIHITGIMECTRVGKGEGNQSVMTHIHSGECKTEILISSYRVISPISGSKEAIRISFLRLIIVLFSVDNHGRFVFVYFS